MGLAVNQLGNLRGFESLPAHHVLRALALIAQLVEHILGKNEVIGSSPIQGSTFPLYSRKSLTCEVVLSGRFRHLCANGI